MADSKIIVKMDRALEKTDEKALVNGRIALANQILIDVDPYIPLRDGPLRLSGRVEQMGRIVSHNTVYARAHYYGTNGIVDFHNYSTPGTGPKWDERAKENHMNSWEQVYVKGAGWQ
ncbi:TPA: capsid protein [Streptococcus suis]|nr:capsid protein [Streptococcus suis]